MGLLSDELPTQTDASAPPVKLGLPPGQNFSLAQGWKFIFRPLKAYAEMRRQYGDVATLYNSPAGNLVLTLTPEGARQVLTSDPDGYDASHKPAFRGLAGDGSLLVLDGARHRAERRLLMPAFHTQNLANIGQIIRDIAITHTDGWRPGQRIKAYDAMLDISRDQS